MNSFSSRVIAWHQRHGRHSLPWQGTRDPYRVWLSEIMLQQTQVGTVIPYYERFIARFPDLRALAAADQDEVLALWSGLGYYSRARNLLAAARLITGEYAGVFPGTPGAIARLPGIGRSTAAAIAALAFGLRCAILDGNVKRVLARHCGISGWPGERKTDAALWALADSRLPESAIESYTQGMMDLGALVCTRSAPACAACPVSADCVAAVQHRVDELPTPRPRKTLPEKEVQMLLLVDHGRLLLEKRPPAGIWGGLWSLPELAAEADAARHCRDRFGFRTISQRTLPALTHTFTHFKLHIRPVHLDVTAGTGELAGRMWLPFAAALGAALPAPVRRLVQQLDPA